MSASGASVETRCPVCDKKNRVPAAASGIPRCGHCHAALAWIVEADDANFDLVAVKSPIPVLVDLWAPWCGPCRMVSPTVQQMATQFAGRLKVVKVNVDEAPATARRYEAMSIPTLLVLKGGKTVERIVGALPAPQLRTKVSAALEGL